MNGGITQPIRYLCKIQLVVPYHLLSGIDLHPGEEFDHSAALGVPEQLLELGASYQVIFAYFINGELLVDMLLHIPHNPVVCIAAASCF